MDNKCQLCCKRNGEICRTNYFQQLIVKHLTPNFEGTLCICESCGQVLRHWDEFSSDAQENLCRKDTEPDSCQSDSALGRSCDQETQTDFENESQAAVHDHSYAKISPPIRQQKLVEDESCQVDSSSLGMYYAEHTGYHPIKDFSNNSFYESSDSEIKILEVVALQDEQWDDPPEKEDFECDLDPAVKVKDEPPEYDDYEEAGWTEDFFYPQVPAEAQQLAFIKIDHHPIKDEAGMFVPMVAATGNCKVKPEIKEELEAEKKPVDLPPPAPTPLPDSPAKPSAPSVHRCPICSIDFPSNDLLVQHLRSHENFFKPALNLACPDCNQEFLSEHILIEHIMEYHYYTNERGEVSCVICGQLQSDGAELRKHIFNCHFNTNPHATHTTGVISAEVAKKRTAPVEEETKKHQKTTTTFSCKLCNIKLASKAKLEQHLEQKHKGKKIVVKKANEVAKKKAIVTPIKSNEIGSKGLKLHSERNNRFYCKLCMKSFPSARGTACHITMVHKQQYNLIAKPAEPAENTKGPFHCRKCKKVFVYYKRFKSHICVVPQAAPAVPTERGAPYFSFSFVCNYRKLESGEYQCKLCPKKSMWSYSGMVKHLRKEHFKECRARQADKVSGEKKVPETSEKEVKRSESKEEAPTSRELRALKETQPHKTGEGSSPKLPPRDKVYTRMKRRQAMFACEACSRRFLTKKQLRIHRKRLCKRSRAVQNSMAQYYLPRRAHFLCNVCYKTENEFEFHSEDDVKHHLDLDHNLTLQSCVEVQFVCKFCSLVYKCRPYLKIHIKQKHKEELEASMQASETKKEEKPKKVAEAPEVSKEESPRTPVKQYKCKVCSKKFPLRIALLRHMQIKHSPPEIKTEPPDEEEIPVEKSAEVFPDPPSPTAISENRNACTICGKVFKLSIALQKHIETHSVIRPSPTVVEPSAASESAPIVKLEVPAPMDPPAAAFKCQICSKSFQDGEQLQVHSNSHIMSKESVEKKKESNQASQPAKKGLLTCDLCDKGLTFFSQIALDQHKRKYHKPS